MHGRTTVGRREHEDARLARAGRHEFAEVRGGAREVGVRTEDAQPSARDGAQAVTPVVVDEVVLPVSEEGEIVVSRPPQERSRLSDLIGCDAGGWMLLDLIRRINGFGAHARPVLHCLAHIAEHTPQ